MKTEDLKVDVVLRIPAGADLIRKATYYARVLKVEVNDDRSYPYAHLHVAKMNAAGRPTRRYRRDERRMVDVTVYAIVDTREISEHAPRG